MIAHVREALLHQPLIVSLARKRKRSHRILLGYFRQDKVRQVVSEMRRLVRLGECRALGVLSCSVHLDVVETGFGESQKRGENSMMGEFAIDDDVLSLSAVYSESSRVRLIRGHLSVRSSSRRRL